MEHVVPVLRTQAQVLADLKVRLRDPSNVKWSAIEMYTAINDALTAWATRVKVPYVYTIVGGWVPGTYEYTIPNYISQPMVPQHKVLMPYINDSGDSYQFVWADILGFTVEPAGDGTQVLRIAFNEGVVGTTNEARLFWWGNNTRVPTTPPAVQTTIDDDDVSLVLSASVDIDPVGYVKVDAEYIQYAGFTDDGSNTTLTNLVRGVNSTAATHTSTTAVSVCVALPDVKLLDNLYWQAAANAYAFYMTDAADTERERMQWNMRYAQAKADEFWRGWVPHRTHMKLDQRSTGVAQ